MRTLLCLALTCTAWAKIPAGNKCWDLKVDPTPYEDPDVPQSCGASGTCKNPDQTSKCTENCAAPQKMTDIGGAKWTGRLKEPGNKFVCSGFLVGDDVVATAGHCCYGRSGQGDTAKRMKSLVFELEYPFQHKSFDVVRACVPHGWRNDYYDEVEALGYCKHGACYDFCLLQLDRGAGGYIETADSDNIHTGTRMNHYGYPGNCGQGREMYAVQGYTGTRQPERHSGKPVGMYPMGCAQAMTGGSSGGPWLVFNPAKAPRAVGLKSSRLGSQKTAYSPRFGEEFIRTCGALGGCPERERTEEMLGLPSERRTMNTTIMV